MSNSSVKEHFFTKKAVIFDLDGTLIDSLKAWEKVDRVFFAKRGLTYSQDEYFGAIMGMSLSSAAEYTINRYKLNDKPEDILAEWNNSYHHLFKTEIKFFPRAEDLLMQLVAKNIVFGIATAGPKLIFDLFFEQYPQLKSHVAAFVSVDDVGRNKPDPAVYLECARRLNAQIQDCVIVEDSLVGLEGAKLAGCNVVCALTDQKHREKKISMCDAYFENYSELLE